MAASCIDRCEISLDRRHSAELLLVVENKVRRANQLSLSAV